MNPSSWSHEVKLPLEDEGILIPQKEGGIAKSFSMESMVPLRMNDEVRETNGKWRRRGSKGKGCLEYKYMQEGIPKQTQHQS